VLCLVRVVRNMSGPTLIAGLRSLTRTKKPGSSIRWTSLFRSSDNTTNTASPTTPGNAVDDDTLDVVLTPVYRALERTPPGLDKLALVELVALAAFGGGGGKCDVCV
jgi:hypothetical protein